MQGESKTIGKGKRLRRGTYDRMLALAAHALAEVFELPSFYLVIWVQFVLACKLFGFNLC